MDPLSRRAMWDIINRERGRRSIVLTSHDMEEVEALCTRVGIMAAGRLRCLGSLQHLKSRLGGGGALEVRVDPAAGAVEHAAAELRRLLPGATLCVRARHSTKLRFELPRQPLAGVGGHKCPVLS